MKDFTVDGVNELFESVEFGVREPLLLKKILEKSGFLIGAYDGDRLVGFARTFDDGGIWAIVCDLCIHPDYRKCGIASEIMAQIKIWATDDGFRTLRLFADVSTDPGLFEFYKKCGFKKMDNAMRSKGFAW